eukprot:775091-Rhodomonas_salina.1
MQRAVAKRDGERGGAGDGARQRSGSVGRLVMRLRGRLWESQSDSVQDEGRGSDQAFVRAMTGMGS